MSGDGARIQRHQGTGAGLRGAFAAAGLAVLVFDYRHFGASGGEPRQLVDVGKQREDYHAAVRCARTLRGSIRSGSRCGGLPSAADTCIAVAAEDPRIAAVVAQVPLIDARRTGRTRWQRLRRALTRSVLKLFVAAVRDALRGGPWATTIPGARRRPDRERRRSAPIRKFAAVFTELGGEAAGMAQCVCPAVLVRVAAVSRWHGGAAADAPLGVRGRSRPRGLSGICGGGGKAGSSGRGATLPCRPLRRLRRAAALSGNRRSDRVPAYPRLGSAALPLRRRSLIGTTRTGNMIAG